MLYNVGMNMFTLVTQQLLGFLFEPRLPALKCFCELTPWIRLWVQTVVTVDNHERSFVTTRTPHEVQVSTLRLESRSSDNMSHIVERRCSSQRHRINTGSVILASASERVDIFN